MSTQFTEKKDQLYLQMYVPHVQQHPKLQRNHHQWQSQVMQAQV